MKYSIENQDAHSVEFLANVTKIEKRAVQILRCLNFNCEIFTVFEIFGGMKISPLN